VKKIKGKVQVLIVLLILMSMAIIHINVKPAHATILSITLTSPDDGYHSLDTTPAFIFQPVSNVSTTINCTLYVNDVASGDVQATNNTATSVTCNHTLTVAETPYEWYINATDSDETSKSTVRNIYVVPDTGPIDKNGKPTPKPDDYEPDQEGPKLKAHEIVGSIVFFLFLGFLIVMFGGKRGRFKSLSRHSKR